MVRLKGEVKKEKGAFIACPGRNERTRRGRNYI